MFLITWAAYKSHKGFINNIYNFACGSDAQESIFLEERKHYIYAVADSHNTR